MAVVEYYKQYQGIEQVLLVKVKEGDGVSVPIRWVYYVYGMDFHYIGKVDSGVSPESLDKIIENRG